MPDGDVQVLVDCNPGFAPQAALGADLLLGAHRVTTQRLPGKQNRTIEVAIEWNVRLTDHLGNNVRASLQQAEVIRTLIDNAFQDIDDGYFAVCSSLDELEPRYKGTTIIGR